MPVERAAAKGTGSRRRSGAAACLAGVLLALVGQAAPAAQAAEREGYIVVLGDPVARPAAVARAHRDSLGAAVSHVYRHALRGYAARMDARAVRTIRADHRVAYVVRDGDATIQATQADPPWGLDRIDQRKLPLSTTFGYANTGAGVTAYVLDTGIRTTHGDFGGRARHGWDFVGGDADASDCHGHGTHVAGTIGGATYGVAKGVALVAVRVLGCTGSAPWSTIIAGIDWVTADHDAGEVAVANMSLGGSANLAVDQAVRGAIADGVSFVVAAGNSSASSCLYSPARVPEALTVGASTKTDERASFSNYGTCLDLFAPGAGVKSAWYTGDAATSTLSGTSMASPHTAGVAALYLQSHPSASPSTVHTAITAAATPKVVKGLSSRLTPGTKNVLLFTDH